MCSSEDVIADFEYRRLCYFGNAFTAFIGYRRCIWILQVRKQLSERVFTRYNGFPSYISSRLFIFCCSG